MASFQPGKSSSAEIFAAQCRGDGSLPYWFQQGPTPDKHIRPLAELGLWKLVPYRSHPNLVLPSWKIKKSWVLAFSCTLSTWACQASPSLNSPPRSVHVLSNSAFLTWVISNELYIILPNQHIKTTNKINLPNLFEMIDDSIRIQKRRAEWEMDIIEWTSFCSLPQLFLSFMAEKKHWGPYWPGGWLIDGDQPSWVIICQSSLRTTQGLCGSACDGGYRAQSAW